MGSEGIRKAQEYTADVIDRKARDLGLQGVGGCLVHDPRFDKNITPTIRIVDEADRDADPNKGEDDTGANYMAIGLSKMAEMLLTLKDSGTVKGRAPKKGEFKYRGGAIMQWGKYWLFTFFSGGTEDEDYDGVAQPSLKELHNRLLTTTID